MKNDGFAIASLVLGIIGLVFFWFPVCSILAIIFAAISISRINKSDGQLTGKGMAIAGLVLGIISVAIIVLVFVIVGAGAAAFMTEFKKFGTGSGMDSNLRILLSYIRY